MAAANILALPTISALRHLEPRPGGQWAVTRQSSDSYSLAYIMDGGADAICFTMQPCATEEDVRAHCGSLIYSYSEDHVTGAGDIGTTDNIISGAMHLVLRSKEGHISNDSDATGLEELALDPLVINSAPESHNSHNEGDSHLQFVRSQAGTQNTMYELNNGSTNDQHQQHMMNGNLNWPASDSIMPMMSTMAQLPGAQDTIVRGNDSNGILSDLWNEEFGRVGVMDGATRQSGWQFTGS